MRIMQASEFKLKRAVEYGTEAQNEAVKQIIASVKADGDAALRDYAVQFDHVKVDELRLTEAEIADAYEHVEPEFLTAIRQAAANIRAFHEMQKRASWFDTQPNGSMLGMVLRPLRRVGLYVPGGKAAYPSSVLMNAIPAQIAGVPEIAMVTPPATAGAAGVNPHIVVAAAEVGIREIYRAGGAQAIAALAYGTESIAPVDKIVGPGNIFVALAKRHVYGVVDIDSIAGPSEIVVLADETANPAYVAADLLSQAEHDEMASAVLVTPSLKLAQQVQLEVERQLALLPRQQIAVSSLRDYGAILLVSSIAAGIDTVNQLAPEHLELLVAEPFQYLGQIENAGAIFLGPYSSETVGDYWAGPNHILPTNGTARFSSPLNVDDFVKKSSVIYYSKEALMSGGEQIITLAKHEGLEGHARAIEVRLSDIAKSFFFFYNVKEELNNE